MLSWPLRDRERAADDPGQALAVHDDPRDALERAHVHEDVHARPLAARPAQDGLVGGAKRGAGGPARGGGRCSPPADLAQRRLPRLRRGSRRRVPGKPSRRLVRSHSKLQQRFKRIGGGRLSLLKLTSCALELRLPQRVRASRPWPDSAAEVGSIVAPSAVFVVCLMQLVLGPGLVSGLCDGDCSDVVSGWSASGLCSIPPEVTSGGVGDVVRWVFLRAQHGVSDLATALPTFP